MTSAIVPAFNEEARIGATLRALGRVPGIDEMLVVDDGSSDGTAEAAEACGARVIRLPVNRGKGAALDAGVEAATGDILLLLDADLGETADEAGLLLAPVQGGDADMAIATFPVVPGHGGGMGLVVRLSRWGIRRATGRTMATPLSGQRALRRSVLAKQCRFASGFGVETALTMDALRAGFRVIEIQTQMAHRVTGRDLRGTLHRARQFAAVARTLWARRKLLTRGNRDACT